MDIKYIPFFFWVSLLWIGLGGAELSGQTRGNALEITLGAGSSGLNLSGGIADSVIVGGSPGFRFGGNFILGINQNLGIGLGLGLNRYSITTDLPGFATTQSGSSHPDIEAEYNSFDQSIVASSVSESIELSEFVIPVFVDIQFGTGKARPFSRLGFGVTVPSGTYQNQQGTIGYEARFEDLPRINSAETFGVTLQDLDKYGFDSGIQISDSLQNLVLSSSSLSMQLNVGIRFEMSPNLYFFGEGYFSSSTNLSAYNVNNYSPAQTPTDYQSMLAGVEKASVNRIGLNVGLGVTLGKSAPVLMEKIEIQFEQKPESRRNPAVADVEFQILAAEILSSLVFKPSNYKVRINPFTEQLEYAANTGNPEAITVSSKDRTSYMNLDQFDSRYKSQDQSFHLILTPPNNKSLTLTLQDEDTDSEVDGFEVEIKVGDKVAVPKTKMSSGSTIYKLYDHPEIKYQVNLTHPCYPRKSFSLNSADFDKPKVIKAESQGEPEEILLSVLSTVPDFLRIQGGILKNGRRTPLSGTYSDGEISLYAGCGESPGENFQLTIEKPLGYNLFVGSESRGWRQPDLLVSMQNGKPAQTLKLEPIPTYNLFYIDISEAQNRNLIRKPVMEQVRELRGKGNDFLVFLSNGQSPYVAENDPTNFRSVMRQLVLSSPDVPKAETDRSLLLSRMKLNEILPTRRLVNMHFYLSKSLYDTSREQLINELTAAFPEGQENIRIFIHTDFEIPESDKLERGLYRTPIEYIYLR